MIRMSDTHAHDDNGRRHLLWLLPLALVCLFANLGGGSVKQYDEARYAEVAREMVENGRVYTLEWNYSYYHKKPPLAIWATALSYKLFGVSELTTRLFSAICGFLTVFASYLLGRRLIGGRAAFFGAVILATSPMFLKYARLGMLDGPLTLFVTLAFLAYARSRENPRYIGWIGFAFAAALLTKSAAAMVIPLVIVTHALLARESAVVRRPALWTGLAAGGVIGASWFILQRGLYADVFERVYYHVVTRAVTPIENHAGGPFFYMWKMLAEGGIFAVVGMAGLALLAWKLARGEREPRGALLLSWFVVVVGGFTAARSKIVWYVLPAVPALCLAGGWLIDRIPRRIQPVTAISAAVVALLPYGFAAPWIATMDYTPAAKRLCRTAADDIRHEDTLYAYRVPFNAILYYTGIKCRRADDDIRFKLLVESVRARGERSCIVHASALAELEAKLPVGFGAHEVARELDWRLVRVHAPTDDTHYREVSQR